MHQWTVYFFGYGDRMSLDHGQAVTLTIQQNLNENTNIIFIEYVYESVICKMAAIFFRLQCVSYKLI